MTLDPYRTLGLEPGASSAEVKRAYRRLAKAFHPDSAGESALPRFLAIHEAYEAIRTGRPMGASRAPSASTAASSAEPWRADPARARAARERARAARERARTSRADRGGSTARGGAGARDGKTASSGTSSSGAGSSGTSGSRSGRRGGTRKATLGSTSYDEARDPADASWSGASWYGPTSGEYWIINPREYADPRKHGPEYQSRARRMAADPSVSGTLEGDAPYVETPVEDDSTDDAPNGERWTGSGSSAASAASAAAAASAESDAPAAPGAATATGEGWARRLAFETRAAAADPARRSARAERLRQPPPAPREPVARDLHQTGEPGWATPRANLGIPSRDWLGGSADDPIRRLGLALVAWPPLGLAAAAAIGDVTGCSTFSATCGGTDALLPWLAQAGILGLLLLLPALARLLAAGSIAVLLALVPATAFLVVIGASGAPQAGFALAFLLGIAWLAGLGWFVLTGRRRDASRGARGVA